MSLSIREFDVDYYIWKKAKKKEYIWDEQVLFKIQRKNFDILENNIDKN